MLFKKPKLNKMKIYIKSCLHFKAKANESHSDYKFPLLIFLFADDEEKKYTHTHNKITQFDRKNNEVEYNGKERVI